MNLGLYLQNSSINSAAFQKKMEISTMPLSFTFYEEHFEGGFFFSFEKIFTAKVQTLDIAVWNFVVGLEFATAYAFIDNLFLIKNRPLDTWDWLIFFFRILLKFKFFIWIATENDALGLFIPASMECGFANFWAIHKEIFGQFMTSKTNRWYPEIVFHSYFGVA